MVYMPHFTIICLVLSFKLPMVLSTRQHWSSVSLVNQSIWQAFNQSISGRLYDGQPMMAPCYKNYNGNTRPPDLQACLDLRDKQFDSMFIADHFGGYQNANWASCQSTGDGCTIDSPAGDHSSPLLNETCMQGSIPQKYVKVTGVEDVQQSLAFATEHNLRLVIKNTGHDYKGRSSAPDSFALWMHPYQPPIELNANFIPDGCVDSVGDVITFGAGQEFQGIYDFARRHNVRVVGGTSSSVGAAGGWITGGGHSVLSNELGLGVDNVQQLRAVLPNGSYITANRCQNQDIFFALRGGGGGTFGIVMEMSTLAHPEKKMELAQVTLAGVDRQMTRKIISTLVSNSEKWGDQGWGGYIQFTALEDTIFTFSMATSMLTHSEALESMQPILDAAEEAGFALQANVTSLSNYSDFIDNMITAPASSAALSSRIVPRKVFQGQSNQKRLTSIIEELVFDTHVNSTTGRVSLLICVTTPMLYSRNLPSSDQPGGPGEASVTPAWRDGLWHAIHIRSSSGGLSNPTATWQAVHQAINPLRKFTPTSGAYQNEADPFEPNPVAAFWGNKNYKRLMKIKEQVDPSNLLTVHQGVGWDTQDDRYSCYPEL